MSETAGTAPAAPEPKRPSRRDQSPDQRRWVRPGGATPARVRRRAASLDGRSGRQRRREREGLRQRGRPDLRRIRQRHGAGHPVGARPDRAGVAAGEVGAARADARDAGPASHSLREGT